MDSFNHSNVNKLFYLIPSITAKLFILAYVYKLYGNNMIQEKINNIFYTKKSHLKIDEINISEKDLYEVELIEDEASRLAKIYEINQKQKLASNTDNKISKFLKENEYYHDILVNLGVGLTALSVLI
jgi:hypothetical protein